jgi:hypothetical protein
VNGLIAGHTFIDGRCECGRKWVDIKHVDMTYMNEVGYAHTGGLNIMEIAQIMAEAKIERDLIEVTTRAMGEGDL